MDKIGPLPLLAAAAVAGAAAAAAVWSPLAPASSSRGGGGAVVLSGVGCIREVKFAGQRYRPASLPMAKRGKLLLVRARLQCQPELVCRVHGGCNVSAARPVTSDLQLRRVQGIKPFLAVVDAQSGQLYVNRGRFPVFKGGAQLWRLLREGGGPPPPTAQAPPGAFFLSSHRRRELAAVGDYCWSAPSADGTRVQACRTAAPASIRFDLPVIVAEPGASLRTVTGIGSPASVQISLINGSTSDYTEPIPPSQRFSWKVPTGAPEGSLLEIAINRSPAIASQDWVKYLARLRVAHISSRR